MTLFDSPQTPLAQPAPVPAPVVPVNVELTWTVTQRYRLDGLWREIATASFRGVTLLRCQIEADPPVYDSFAPRSPRSLNLPDVLAHIVRNLGT